MEYFEGGQTPNFQKFASGHRGRKRNQMQVIGFGDTVGVRYNIQSSADDFEIYNVVSDPQETKNLANETKGVLQLQEEMKAKVLQVRMPNQSAPRPYDDALIPACAITKLAPGLTRQAYRSDIE